ncbi:MAG: sulfatase, partial [Acidobacteria bacterium]|nr:sulfatase [Acidobacteriota bacterium]
MQKIRKKIFIIAGILFLVLICYFLIFSPFESSGSIDFIEVFSSLNKKMSMDGKELDSFLQDQTGINLDPEMERDINLGFSNAKILLNTTGNAESSSGKHPGKGEGFRISASRKSLINSQIEFVFNAREKYGYKLVFDFSDSRVILKSQTMDDYQVLKNAPLDDPISIKQWNDELTIHILTWGDSLLITGSGRVILHQSGLNWSGIDDYRIKLNKNLKDRNPVLVIKYTSLNTIILQDLFKAFPSAIKNVVYYWNQFYPDHLDVIRGVENIYVQKIHLRRETMRSLVVPAGSEISWEGKLPEQPRLDFKIAVIDKYINDLQSLDYKVVISSEKTEKVFKYNLKYHNYLVREWQAISIDLKEFAGDKVKVLLKPVNNKGKNGFKNRVVTLWGNPVIRSARKNNEYNVILISLDTLRADHLGCYNYPRETSKNIDEFARKGTIFLNTISSSSWTLPAHISMFTGLYPFEAGANSEFKSDRNIRKSRLASEVYPLAEYFKSAGYATNAFTGGGFVSAYYGFNRGFEGYVENILDAKKRDIAREMPRVLRWIKHNKNNKFFVFFHTFEIHHIYLRRYFKADNPNDINQRVIANYDSGIRYADIYIGEMLKLLKDEGLMNKTLVVITSDHGENFDFIGPSNSYMAGEHGRTLKDSELKIPLIIGGPEEFMKSIYIEEQVRMVDIVPTILDFVGIELKIPVRGLSLMGMVEKKSSEERERLAYSEGIRIWKEPYCDEKSIRGDNTKVIKKYPMQEYNGTEDNLFELYDLSIDPEERNNVYPENRAKKKILIK